MSMYSEILAKALVDEPLDDTSAHRTSELLQAVNERRADVLESRTLGTEGRVACEVAYDVAIMRLCAAMGIEVTADQFSSPTLERERLVRQLEEAERAERAERRRVRRPAGKPTGRPRSVGRPVPD
jgi:hypothetical protein